MPLFIKSQTLLLISRWKPNHKGSAKAASYVAMVGAALFLT